jgi:hypothetical protein
MKYVRVFADDEGVTHFEDLEPPMTMADYSPPAPPLRVSAHQSASGVIAIDFPAGWYGDFHPAPKRQWMIIVAGTLEIGVSDGEKRICPAGTVALVEDPGSKGHSTRVIGDEPSSLMVVEVD